MNITIRHAEVDDYKAIHQVYLQPAAYSGTLQLPYVSSEVWKKRLTSNSPDSYSLVACVDGEIVGSIGLHVVGRSPRRRHVGTIGMGVHDQWRRRGVGGELLKAVLNLADNWLNLMRIELTVFTDNDAAVKLYKKFGFQVEGQLEKYAFRDGAYVDAFSMARIKNEGA